MKKDKYCLITNDVETTSVLNHRLDDDVDNRQVAEKLVEIYENNIRL